MTEGIVVLFPKIIHFSAYWALPVCHEADGCHFAGLWLCKLMIQFFFFTGFRHSISQGRTLEDDKRLGVKKKMLVISTCIAGNGPVPWLWQDLWLFNLGAGVEITAAVRKKPNGCKGTELFFLENGIKK